MSMIDGVKYHSLLNHSLHKFMRLINESIQEFEYYIFYLSKNSEMPRSEEFHLDGSLAK